MHILVVNPYLVGEYIKGGSKRILRMIKHFARTETVSLACFSGSHGTGSRTWRSEVYDYCRHVNTASLDMKGMSRRVFNFFCRSQPTSVYFLKSDELQRKIRAIVDNEKVDLIHVEFFEMGPYALKCPKYIPKVIVSQELVSAAKQVDRSATDRLKRWIQAPKVKRYEKRIAGQFDRVYCVTKEEKASLEGRGISNCGVYPHVVDTDEFSPSALKKEKEGTILFIGNFDHKPNVDALRWFLQQIFPLVETQHPSVRFHVVGVNFKDDMLNNTNTNNVKIVGEVEDIRAYYDDMALFVNPIVSGGGMRGKVLEAMSMSKAVVSTPLGMQGIESKDGEEVVLAREAREFANKVVGLLGNPEKRKSLGRRARTCVCALYDERRVFTQLLREYHELVEGKMAQREQ